MRIRSLALGGAFALLAVPPPASAVVFEAARPAPAEPVAARAASALPAASAALRAASLPLFPNAPSSPRPGTVSAPLPVVAPAGPAPRAVPTVALLGDPAPLAPAAAVYERPGTGFLVVDVKDSTRMHLTLGTRRAHDATDAALDFAEQTAARFDGVVIRRLGDGHLIAFPDKARAVDAGLAIQAGVEAWRTRAGLGPLELHAAAHGGRALIDASGPVPEIYGRAVEKVLALAGESRGGDLAVLHGDRTVLLRPVATRGPDPVGEQRPLGTVRREVVATLFASLVDWSGTYDRFGKRAAYATTKAFHAFASEVVRRHGGTFVKTEGETVMAVFANPEDAVRAGVELHARREDLRAAAPLGAEIRLRAGISFGRAIREDRLEGPDFFGNTVNAAARLMKLAKPGEILVSERALEAPAARSALAPESSHEVSLKGFDRPVAVARATPPAAARDADATARLKAVADEALARLPPRP